MSHLKLYGFFASPAYHSKSPLMYNTSFAHDKIEATYVPFDIPADNFEKALDAIRTLKIQGGNFSMPHKVTAAKRLDELSVEAQLIGAVNTFKQVDGKLFGYNTDGPGFIKALEAHDQLVKGKEVILLGAGGAAKSTLVSLVLEKAEKITIFARESQNKVAMMALMERLSSYETKIEIHNFEEQKAYETNFKSASILINATNVGMAEQVGKSPLQEVSLLHRQLFVADMIYKPEQTELLKQVQKRGLSGMNGIEMLYYQGEIAYEIWTGKQMIKQTILPLLQKEG